MNSILQDNKDFCYLCGRNRNFEPLDKHHIFGGSMRKKSEQYGLFVFIHHNTCHIFGSNSVHQNNDISVKLKQIAQQTAMDRYGWSVDDFINIFGLNYL